MTAASNSNQPQGAGDPAVALGRENSLFAGNKGGASRCAIVASLPGTARLNSVEPYMSGRATA